jgi:hypothetical protein
MSTFALAIVLLVIGPLALLGAGWVAFVMVLIVMAIIQAACEIAVDFFHWVLDPQRRWL